MRCRSVFLLLTLFCVSLAHARHLSGRVVDAKTGDDIPGATVELLSPADSSLIRTAVSVERTLFGDWKYYSYEIDVDNNTVYLLRFSSLGYRPCYKKVSVKMADRVNEQTVEDVRLEEDFRVLDEVVVRSTRIKMVMKGDTLVYDASAFNLGEGSMLNALVRQMPGTTLENGVIKVNGRTVSSLLVDGRDFFKGDAKQALENLPAYTVDKIRVYDKRGKESRLMGLDMGDKELVLDVGLKKQYQHGFMSNADLAAGTHGRYLGRLFSMFYTKKCRLTLTGMMNNVNDINMPGQESSVGSMPMTDGGLSATKRWGLEYRREGKSEDDFLETSNTFQHDDNETRTRTNMQTFLAGGDYYNLSRQLSRSKNTTWSTRNRFGWNPAHHMLNAYVGVNYSQSHRWGGSLSGQFSEKPWSSEMLDSLYLPGASRRLLAAAVNRQRNDRKSNGQSINYDVEVGDHFAFGDSDDRNNMLSLYANFGFHHDKDYSYAFQQVDYSGGTFPSDRRHQHVAMPDEGHHLQVNADYVYLFKCDSDGVSTFFVRPFYRFNRQYSSADHQLFRLDQLSGYAAADYPLGVLPSTRDALLSVLDAHNSYRNREGTTAHQAGATIRFSHGDGIRMPQVQISASLPLEFRHETLDYYRERDYARNRHSLLFNPNVTFGYQFNDSTGTRFASVNYSTSQQQPSLTSLLDISDDAQPLVVTLGNPDLAKARNHSVMANMGLFDMRRQRMMNLTLTYAITQNAIATSMLYDKQTGKTTRQQVNVNGNWNAGASLTFQQPVDRLKRLTVSATGYVAYNNSVDLVMVDGASSGRSNVHNWNASQQLELIYQIDSRLRVFTGADVSYQRATGNRSGFQTIAAWNYHFKVGGNASLPWGFELSTDLTDYHRSGYNDEQMNTSELVWNARLTKKLQNDQLTFSLDAFDVLGRLNNTQFTIDAQGRTETWTNIIPRYLMLHCAYRFTLGMKQQR